MHKIDTTSVWEMRFNEQITYSSSFIIHEFKFVYSL